MLYTKNKKMSQNEFFILKLNELATKDMKRAEIQELFAKNDIKYSPRTLDRALKEWRGSPEPENNTEVGK